MNYQTIVSLVLVTFINQQMLTIIYQYEAYTPGYCRFLFIVANPNIIRGYKSRPVGFLTSHTLWTYTNKALFANRKTILKQLLVIVEPDHDSLTIHEAYCAWSVAVNQPFWTTIHSTLNSSYSPAINRPSFPFSRTYKQYQPSFKVLNHQSH